MTDIPHFLWAMQVSGSDVYSLIEKKLTEPEGKKLGLEIMQKLNDYCTKWKEAENIDYSIYRNPAGVYNLLLREEPSETFRHRKGRNRQKLHHEQLPCACNGADRCFQQVKIRV